MSNAPSICPSICYPALPRTDVRNGRTQNRLTNSSYLAFRNARARIRDRGVVMRETELTADEIRERVKWLKSVAREGADALHSRATTVEQRHKPTPTEELARARARADKGTK